MTETTTGSAPHAFLRRVQRRALIVAAVGAVALLVGFFVDPAQAFRAYLFAWITCLAPALGSMAVLMLHDLTGGAWGRAIRPLLEGASRTLPWVALAFVPLFLGLGHVYEWSHEAARAHDPLLAHKAAYLNVPFFAVRAVVYFAVWIGLVHWRARRAERRDRQPGLQTSRALQRLSAGGLLVYVLTMTLASVDWAMSIEPHWFSTIYGVIVVVAQALTAMCFAVVVASAIARRAPHAHVISRAELHDLGNLTLAFVLLWAYVSFSQFLIVWSGDLPEEAPWYLHRARNGWQHVALAVALLHFALPFVVLLSRNAKRNPITLAAVALLILVLRVVDVHWQIMPAFHEGLHVSWLDLAAVLSLGGLWIAAAARSIGARPFLPAGGAIEHGDLEAAVHA